MIELRTGCSGWSYKSWVGPFYPLKSSPSDFLKLYSKVFDTVEIDSTFYNIPEISTVKKWNSITPDGFVFAPKLPRQITHDLKLVQIDRIFDNFIEAIRNLEKKLGPVLIQFPSSFIHQKNVDRFRSFVSDLPSDIEFAVEFRNDSWFREDVYSILEKNGVTFAWSEVPMVATPPKLTTSSIYLRLIGDRTISEYDFGKILRDKTTAMKRWSMEINSLRDVVKRGFVFSNNHFQGFGPGTVNIFRKEVGLEPIDWAVKIREGDSGEQRTLF